MVRARVAVFVFFVLLASLFPASAQQASSSSPAVIPTLVSFSGALTDVNGKPLTAITGVTFSLYENQEGGPPLWIETQNVQPDKNGNYTVMLGATSSSGLPPNLFTAGEARWLGVQAQGQEEQPRVMLLSVPYAMKAGDATTVGGLPPSAFVMANSPNGQSARKATPLSGTQDFIPLFIDNAGDLGNSILYQSGTTSVGIGTTTPSATLEVNGTAKFDNLVTFSSAQTFPGTLTGITAGTGITVGGSKSNPTVGINTTFANEYYPQLNAANTFTKSQTVEGTMTATTFSGNGSSLTNVNAASLNGLASSAFSQTALSNTYQSSPLGTAIPQVFAPVNNATASGGFNSNPIDLAASSYNSTAVAAQKELFRWQAEPAGNNSGSPSGTLNLLFGAKGATPTETGLNIASNGQITFASGQTFPGTGNGTITAVNAGAGLSGGGTSGSVTLANTGLLGLSAGTGISVGSGQTPTVTNTGVLAVTAGTGISSTGGPSPTLSINTLVVPQLNAANTFTGNQTVEGNLEVLNNSNYEPLLVQSSSTFGTWLRLSNTSAGGQTWNILSAASGNSEGAGNLGITNLAGGTIWLEGPVNVSGTLDVQGTGNFTGTVTAPGVSSTSNLNLLTANGGFQMQPTTDSQGNSTVNIMGGYIFNSMAPGHGGQTIAGGGSAYFTGLGGQCAGCWNYTSNDYATVGGGISNSANGTGSTVPGGSFNSATGTNSFAAGNWANAADSYSFVWCATGGLPCNSEGTNSFVVAVNGPIFFFDSPYGTGCNLATGASSWSCSSDRNLKDDIVPIDARSVLERVARLPITQWKTKAEPSGRKHVGPMAQDFYAAFGLGDSDRYIGQGDAQGVALAAIKGLYQEVQEVVREKDAQIVALQRRLAALEHSVHRRGIGRQPSVSHSPLSEKQSKAQITN